MTGSADLASRLDAVRGRIADACAACGRDPTSVALLAVSKTQSADAVRAVAAAGQLAFGENYADEALAKVAACADLALDWHFIGPLQSNKSRGIAEQLAWVHSVDRLRIARRLSDQRPDHLPALNVLVQVKLSDEATKSGCAPDEALALCQAIETLPRLRLRGLMTLPAVASAERDPSTAFRQLRQLFESIRAQLQHSPDFDQLSAGMSDDLEAAIAEGSTMVRVGTAIFGSRPAKA